MEYNKLATKEIVERVAQALKERNVEAIMIESGKDALAKIKELVPKGVSVMNGSSTTLEQIGFVEYLKTGEHGWNNLHASILTEKDPAQQSILRKQAVLSDYYLGSVHALAETGQFVVASNSGSQLPHIVFTSPNIIFVVSTKKIVPSLADTYRRLEEHVIPLEEKHVQEKYGVGTYPSKIVTFNAEKQSKRKIKIILVNEDLGF
ncbi:hypothetical protein A3I95_01130 [Candidatus Nomurabacteria bacterium RIFCSPLOWO2_02_FULL_44_12]|uniref:LUD domain-containing protein n=1 Tax=Candidatus Nomurabacteria bacterium RIFCSPLOWO2_12_FULL_44_11 TaxID=1801796 RepID=A0A1F6Y4B7_9BACT|nr:MAG: hypothetical protein A3G53_03715 [Candidatus Nomurabacteria bacterium RIFCSPLOWO2_12_FULL_44_11]OGJ08702.1 MAG: hypothetical protein A3I95_01130 [Candidatus Nomurabacteria bacterium RIFCSPLOWO2_02_FULL_44_12]